MPWMKQGGRVVKVTHVVEIGDETVAVDGDELACPHCDKTYKTETGLENHLADKH